MANNPYKNKVVYNGQTLIDITDTTATADKVLEGYTFYAASGEKKTGTATGGGVLVEDTLDSHGGTVRTITTTNLITLGTKSITANGTYTASSDNLNGYSSVTVSVGSSAPTYQTKSVTPSETAQTVTPDTGYDALSSVSVGAISSTYVGSGITRRSSSNLTASGATVTVPAGYYESQATKSVTSGTAGTPTATKGTVGNHSVTVTPSVTNTSGYITGSTKTGTAVTVSASELVSGSQTITDNGTVNVTNLASVNVQIPFVTYYTGSSNPSSSTGSNGDIYLKVVS